MVFIRKIKSKIRGRFKANVLKQCSEISPQKMPDRSTEPEPPKSAGPDRNKVQNQKFCRISSETIIEKNQSLNEDRNSETNNRKKGDMEENKVRRGEKGIEKSRKWTI